MAEVKLGDDGLVKRQDFPSNSHKNKEELTTSTNLKKTKKIEKIIKGKVIQKKKPFYKKVINGIIGEEVEDIPNFIFYEILIPSAKQIIDDTISGLLYGSSRTRRTRDRKGGGGHISYSRYYDEKSSQRKPSPNYRSRYSFQDVVLDYREDAADVLDTLIEMIDVYEMASVADLYDMVGLPINHTDQDYGWTSLGDADVRQVRGGGWLIDLPKPILLDR